jgi:hypothetical protein
MKLFHRLSASLSPMLRNVFVIHSCIVSSSILTRIPSMHVREVQPCAEAITILFRSVMHVVNAGSDTSTQTQQQQPQNSATESGLSSHAQVTVAERSSHGGSTQQRSIDAPTWRIKGVEYIPGYTSIPSTQTKPSNTRLQPHTSGANAEQGQQPPAGTADSTSMPARNSQPAQTEMRADVQPTSPTDGRTQETSQQEATAQLALAKLRAGAAPAAASHATVRAAMVQFTSILNLLVSDLVWMCLLLSSAELSRARCFGWRCWCDGSICCRCRAQGFWNLYALCYHLCRC